MSDRASPRRTCQTPFVMGVLVAIGWARLTTEDDAAFAKQCASALLQIPIVYLLTRCEDA